MIKSSSGTTCDLAADFSNSRNPNGPWSYGWLKAGPAPDSASFTAYAKCETEKNPAIGDISNPGSNDWEPVLGDWHTYPRVPHRELEIERLRTLGVDDHNLFLSEYGVGSGVNWSRMLRLYEAMGEESCPTGAEHPGLVRGVHGRLEQVEAWDTFASPEDFLEKCTARMGVLRKMGISALRSNPRIISYSLTGTHDPFSWGEGVLTQFREHKPGAFDCMVDAFAPLRWCLFAEPVSIYSSQKIKIEAVIANEDVLKPGEYPAVVQVLGPGDRRVFEREVTVRDPREGRERGTSVRDSGVLGGNQDGWAVRQVPACRAAAEGRWGVRSVGRVLRHRPA